MTRLANKALSGASLFVVLAALAACTTARTPANQGLPQPAPGQTTAMPQTIAPVQTAQVESTELPPIGGAAAPTVSAAAGVNATSPGFSDASTGVAASGGGRDLSGPLSIDMLLGGWTAMAGGVECRLNLTYTARGASGRYRASAPGCADPALAEVASWQLLGTQVQLYDASDTLIATMAQSGNRFIGTLAGGTALTMVG